MAASAKRVNYLYEKKRLESVYSKAAAAGTIKGVVNQINKVADDTLENLKDSFDGAINWFKNLFSVDSNKLLMYGGLIIVFYIIVNKK